MTKLIERSLLLSLGALTLTREKVAQFADKLVAEREVKPSDAPGVIDRLVGRGEEEREALRKLVRSEVERLTPVSRQDIEELKQQVDVLAKQVGKLAGKKSK